MMPIVSLSTAQTILSGALAHASEHCSKPLAVIVLDAGGQPVLYARQDHAPLFLHAIARAKAKGAIGLKANSRALTEQSKIEPAFFQSLSAIVVGGIALSPGGVLFYDEHKTLLGAVGVSGDTGDLDEACALAGIAKAGFLA
jgi:uncharacterized protein GlcG (DUF336 family)